jgi:hypothetical protein
LRLCPGPSRLDRSSDCRPRPLRRALETLQQRRANVVMSRKRQPPHPMPTPNDRKTHDAVSRRIRGYAAEIRDQVARPTAKSSVSGSSVAHGVLAHHYEALEQAEFDREELDRLVIAPFIDRISEHSLVWALILKLWKVIGPMTRTNLLANTFDEWFFDGQRLDQLSRNCRFVLKYAVAFVVRTDAGSGCTRAERRRCRLGPLEFGWLCERSSVVSCEP